MYKKTALTAVGVLLSLALGCPAAAEQIQQHIRLVSYHDLDLAKPGAVKTFRRRLVRAVNQVCRFPAPGSLVGSQDQECRQHVLSDVEPRVLQVVDMAQKRAAETLLAAR